MFEDKSFTSLLSRLKEEAKNISRATGKKHKVVLEELARKLDFPNYDTLQKLAATELHTKSREVPGVTSQEPLRLNSVVADIPPPAPTFDSALCRTPDEFLANWISFGNPTYAVTIPNDDSAELNDIWFFSNDRQDAVAIGLRWHERGCALEQYPVEQDGEIVYGYRGKNLTHIRHLEADYLYSQWLWKNAGADINAEATPEIMARLRSELFNFFAISGGGFILLDFSNPKDVVEFLEDWKNEI